MHTDERVRMAKDVRKNMNEKYITHNSILESKSSQPSWNSFRMDEIYTERKEPGEEGLPVLSVSIHSGVSDGELDEEELGKKVKRIADKTQYRKAMAGDLVFNMMRAWQGAIGVVKTDGMVSPAYIVAKPNDKVWPLFMDYYMKTSRMIETIHRQSYGVTDFRLRLYWDSFAPIRCTLPPIEEQRRIAEILATQDRVIELYDRKIEQLQRFKKGALSKMFPKSGHNTPEVRFPGFTDAWEQRKFSETFAILQNCTLSRAELSATEGAALNVHYGDVLIKYGEIIDADATELPHIPDASILAKFKASILQDGDVIIADTAEDETVGKCSEMLNLQGKSAISGLHTIPSRPNELFARGYLGYFMNSPAYHDQLLPLMQGTKVTSVSKAALQDTEISFPASLIEQGKIGQYFMALDNLITLHQRKRDEEIRKKKALMQLLLTGTVRVKT